MTAPLPEYYLMRTKDIMNLAKCTKHTAEKIKKDIREWLREKTGVALSYITFAQYKRYFDVP